MRRPFPYLAADRCPQKVASTETFDPRLNAQQEILGAHLDTPPDNRVAIHHHCRRYPVAMELYILLGAPSLIPQRRHRLNRRGTARRPITGNKRDRRQQSHRRHERDRIARRKSEQQRRRGPARP